MKIQTLIHPYVVTNLEDFLWSTKSLLNNVLRVFVQTVQVIEVQCCFERLAFTVWSKESIFCVLQKK